MDDDPNQLVQLLGAQWGNTSHDVTNNSSKNSIQLAFLYGSLRMRAFLFITQQHTRRTSNPIVNIETYDIRDTRRHQVPSYNIHEWTHEYGFGVPM